MKLEEKSTRRVCQSDLICRICGDIARGYNFNVISCTSCKAFFRRNAFRLMKTLNCQRHNNCKIKKDTRAGCSACRLKKCYAFGMNPRLIQSVPQHKDNSLTFDQLIKTNQYQMQLPAPTPINLLRYDCSNLTTDQWTLLSNIICSYDEQNLHNRFKYLLAEKSSLPPKLRLKSSDTFDLISPSLLAIQPLIKPSCHFQHLSPHAQRALVLHNVFITGGLNVHFIVRETNAFKNITYTTAVSAIYGSDYVMQCAQDNERLDSNGTLVKLMLFVLIFSSNCSVVAFNNEEDVKTMSSSIELVHVQDIYVTMLWKYLVYLYGYDQAAIRFSLMVKSVIDMLNRAIEASKNITHSAFIDRIVTEVKQTLVITN